MKVIIVGNIDFPPFFGFDNRLLVYRCPNSLVLLRRVKDDDYWQRVIQVPQG